MESTIGLPGETSPTSRPPISDPREVSERKFSTASRSSRSIKLKGIRTDTGFCGTSQRYRGEAAFCTSKRSARAVDSVIAILHWSNKLESGPAHDDFTQKSLNLGVYFGYFFVYIKCRAADIIYRYDSLIAAIILS